MIPIERSGEKGRVGLIPYDFSQPEWPEEGGRRTIEVASPASGIRPDPLDWRAAADEERAVGDFAPQSCGAGIPDFLLLFPGYARSVEGGGAADWRMVR